MKKILLTLSFLVVAASLSASAPGTTIRRFTAPKILAADASEQLYKVTPELNVDIPGGDIAPGMHAVPHNFTHYDYGADEDYFELPAGMYDFLFYFYKGDENYVVVRENVDVKSDMTVKAAMSEADQLLSARMVLSDGSEILPNTIIGFDNDGERIFADDGNVLAASQCIHLIALNGNSARSYLSQFYRLKKSDGTIEESLVPHIHINRNNALSVVFSSCVTPKDAPAHIITLQANKDNATECVTMEPKLYSKVDQRFPELPAEKQAELGSWFDQGVTFMRGDITICNDEQFGQIASLENFDFGSTMIYDNGLTAVKPRPMLNRTFSMLDSGDSFASGFLYIENEADGFKTLGCNFPASPTNYGNFWPYMIPNPYLVGEMQRDDVVDMSVVPTIWFWRSPWYASVTFWGRYCEWQSVDNFMASLSVKLDGKEVCDNFESFPYFLWGDEAPTLATEWDVEVESAWRKVDGLDGVSRLTAHRNGGDETYSSPGLTAMRFCDADNRTVDRFEKASDGTMILEVGNWSQFQEGYESYSAAGPLDEITVEYAPYGSDDFKPFTYEALDFEGNRSPNWGTTLACALSQVDRTSASGWFDVRVSLKSAAGSSVNLVSPAFRISEFAGIERISDDSATTDAPAEYFTIDGRRISSPESGSIVLCRRAGAVTKLIAR